MSVILINPPPEQIVEAKDLNQYPNMSIAYLASYLESKNIVCRVVDAKFEGSTTLQVLKKCIGEDIIGLTSMTHEISYTAKFAEKIKKRNPKAKIIIGGCHATALPKETIKTFSMFDYLVYGEGEETFYELVKAIKNGSGFEHIDGLAYRDGKNIIQNKPRERIQDLDKIPFPAWHLLPKSDIYPIMTARGCPFSCIFCMRANGSKVRLRSVDNVIEEMKLLVKKYNVKHIHISDETFTVFKDRAMEICDRMIKLGLPEKITWEAETRVNCIDMRMLKKLKEAGCSMLKFGVESGNPEILKAIKKGITVDQARKAIAMAKEAGLTTESLFILGHPNETVDTMKDTINLAVELNTTQVAFGIMTPYPGTEIYNMAITKTGQLIYSSP